jgi:hypothetical protein
VRAACLEASREEATIVRKILLLTPIVASAALLLLAAGPAFAATNTGTGTTFELIGGSLAISAPAGPVDLGSGAASAAAQTISGSLGLVTVTDNRGNVLGWTATALSTAFTAGGTLTVPASAITYASTTPTHTGIAIVTPAAAIDLTTAKTVETATAVIGVNSAAWNPNLTIAVPLGTQTGVYAATLTHSVI